MQVGLTYAVAIIIALIAGGLVNWLADQLPAGHRVLGDQENLDGVQSRSESVGHLSFPRCPQCGQARTPLQFVAVLSLITGQFKCRSCTAPRTGRSILVEVLLLIGFTYLLATYDMSRASIFVLYFTIFLLIAVIDIEHRLVLNAVMLPAFIVALLEIALSGRLKLRDGLLGYAISQLIVMAFYLLGAVYLWLLNSGRSEPVTEVAFGFGDVTLATFCGLAVGYPNVIYMLVLMILFGGAIALLYMIGRAIFAQDYNPHVPIPYGPAIILSAMTMLGWGQYVTAWIYTR